MFALVLLAAGCSTGPSDDQIVTDLKARLYSTEPLKGTNLQVTSHKGEVTLTGEVPSEGARYAAYKLAVETPGVKKVNDQMTVKLAAAEPPPPAEPAAEPPRPAPVRKVSKPAPAPAPAPPREEPPAAQPAPQPAAPASQPAPAPAPPPPPEPKPVKVTIPAGTSLAVRLIDPIDSGVNQPGETFRASLDAPLLDDDGNEVVPRGADVTLRLEEVRAAGRVEGRAELRIEAAYLDFDGRRYSLQTSAVERAGRSEGKRTAATVGTTAAVGAIIGAIAGGGKGAAIGAAAGAGAGTAASVMTKGKQVKVPSETLLEFTLQAPLTVTVMPGKSDTRRGRSLSERP
jgi:hypothetical protein